MRAHWISQTRKLNRHYQSGGGNEGVFRDTLAFNKINNNEYPIVNFLFKSGRFILRINPQTLGNYRLKVSDFTIQNNQLPIAFIDTITFKVNGSTYTVDFNDVVSSDGLVTLKREMCKFWKGGQYVQKDFIVVYYDVTNLPQATYYDFTGENVNYDFEIGRGYRLYKDTPNQFEISGNFGYFTDNDGSATVNQMHIEKGFIRRFSIVITEISPTAEGYRRYSYALASNETEMKGHEQFKYGQTFGDPTLYFQYTDAEYKLYDERYPIAVSANITTFGGSSIPTDFSFTTTYSYFDAIDTASAHQTFINNYLNRAVRMEIPASLHSDITSQGFDEKVVMI